MLANVGITLTGHQQMLTGPWDRDWDPWCTLTNPTCPLGYPQDILRPRQHAQIIDIPYGKGMLANVVIMLTGHQHILTAPSDWDWDPWGTLTRPTGPLGYPQDIPRPRQHAPTIDIP